MDNKIINSQLLFGLPLDKHLKTIWLPKKSGLGRAQTHDFWLIRPTLSPTELEDHAFVIEVIMLLS